MSSRYFFNISPYDTWLDATNAHINYVTSSHMSNNSHMSTSSHNNDQEYNNFNIIKLHCGHFISTKMLQETMVPHFITECDDSICCILEEDSLCDYCSSQCEFICTKCNTSISPETFIYRVQFIGLVNWLDVEYVDKISNFDIKKINKKRKYTDLEDQEENN